MIIPHESDALSKRLGFLPYNENNPKILSDSHISMLTQALRKDASGYLYNGILSIGSGMKSISQGNYGWATIKFYYSVFYLARARLAIEDFCILYSDSKPFILLLRPHETLKKPNFYLRGIYPKKYAGTHKLILTLFQYHFSNDVLLSNEINDQSPLIWLMEQRELMNYKAAVMPDPTIPWQYLEISKKTLRQWLNIYLEDKVLVYPFHADHACFAYPIQFLLRTLDEFNNKRIFCNYLQENSNFIKKLFSDKLGTFDVLVKKFPPDITRISW